MKGSVEANDANDASGTQRAHVTRLRQGRIEEAEDWLVDEVPVALVFNGISHAVMLASPLSLEDFALGFALTEGLLEDRSQLYGIDVVGMANGIEVRLEVAAACEFRMKERRRNLSGRTGCGLCGTESLDQVLRAMPATERPLSVETSAVARALTAMAGQQPMQRISGAAHAAAWCDRDGEASLVREDVGRHNALDKLIGAMVAAGIDASQGFIAVTSRASVEMVQKTLMARVSLLVAVSAPTALAVRVATAHGLALAGFARGRDLVCYTHPGRFGLDIEHASSRDARTA